MKTPSSKTPNQEISPEEKQDNLQKRQRQKDHFADSVPIRYTGSEEAFPLSAIQKSMCLIQSEAPDSAELNSHYFYEVNGPLDVPRLQKALEAVLETHEILRLGIRQAGDHLHGYLRPASNFKIASFDYSDDPQGRENAARYLDAWAQEPFSMDGDEYFLRVNVSRIAADNNFVGFTLHQLIGDGLSYTLFLDAISQAYAQLDNPSNQARLARPDWRYVDFTTTQNTRFPDPATGPGIDWWTDQLQGASMPPLPTDFDCRRGTRKAPAFVEDILSPNEMARFKDLADSLDCRLVVLLMAAYKVLVYRYTEADDIITGLPAENRIWDEFRDVIGPFINTLPIRSKLQAEESFSTLVKRLQQTVMEAGEFQDVPLEQLLAGLNPHQDARDSAFLNCLFNFYPEPEPSLALSDCECCLLHKSLLIGRYALVANFNPHKDGTRVCFSYDNSLFRPETAKRLLDRYFVILRSILENPAAAIGTLPIFTEGELQVLTEWSQGPDTDYPREAILSQLFEATASACGTATALNFGNESLSYYDLNARANRMARLLQEKGLSAGGVCALLMDRSERFVVAVLAILKCGGVYLPVDPSLPAERLGFILSDACAQFMVTEVSEPGIDPHSEITVINYTTAEEAAANASAENVPFPVQPDGSACANIMYTSGSTGVPKGIEIAHRGITRLTSNPVHNPMDRNSVVLFASAVSFDASTWELWNALLNGAKLVVLPPKSHDPAIFRDLIRQFGITHISLTTALFHVFVEEDPECFKGTQAVIVGGEALKREPARAFFRANPEIRLSNTYGPTENTVDSTYFDVPRTLGPTVRTVPIGRPVARSSAWVLDADFNPCPVGISGELFIGGDGVALRYLGRPELTRKSFVNLDTPILSGRFYRSGDFCRWNEQGQLEFLGRKDDQVKYRGYRIELGEIESALQSIEGVSNSVVLLDEEESLQPVLIGAYCGNPYPSVAHVREALKALLPAYMVPSILFPVLALPINASGKVDQRALLELVLDSLHTDSRVSETDTSTPASPAAAILADIWREVLNVRVVKPHDTFFGLGGHSLKLVQIRSRIERRMGVPISIRHLYEYPVFQDLLKSVENLIEAGQQTAALPPVESHPVSGPYPLSWPQLLIYMGGKTAGDPFSYHIPVFTRLSEEIDLSRLEAAVERLIDRHAVLRTAFREGDDLPLQETLPSARFKIDRLADGIAIEWKKVVPLLREYLERPFTLSEPPLMRMGLIRLTDGGVVLAWVGHHLIFDGWSVDVFFQELEICYADASAILPSLPIRYADFCHWQSLPEVRKVHEENLRWWLHQMKDLPAQEWLPQTGADTPETICEPVRIEFDDPASRELIRFCRENQVSLTSTLLSTLLPVLLPLIEPDEASIGMPVSGRHEEALEGVLGTFVNTLPIRGKPEPGELFLAWCSRFHQHLQVCLDHDHLPFNLLTSNLDPARHPSANRLIAALFTLNEPLQDETEFLGLPSERVPLFVNARKAPLTFNMSLVNDRITGHIEFDRGIFSRAAVSALVQSWKDFSQASVRHPESPLGSLPLMDAGRLAEVLQSGTGSANPYPSENSVYQQFDDVCSRHAGQVALEWNGTLMTYSELRAKAGSLAELLSTKIPRGTRVGVPAVRCMGRIITELALLKLGAVFVPLDPDAPVSRIREIIDITDMGYLVETNDAVIPEALAQLEGVDHLRIRLDQLEAPTPSASAGLPAGPEDPAYVMFTSGSTGVPKGVVVPHRAIMRLVLNTDYIVIQPGEGVAHLSNPAFDAVTFEVWGALLNGGRLVILDKEVVLNSQRFITELSANRFQHLFLTTALFNILVREKPDCFKSLKTVLFGGEKANPALTRDVLEAGPPVRFCNIYGPTENTTFSTCFRLSPSELVENDIPIGRPIANSSAWVLSPWGQLLPPPLTGEICVAGDGLALGYLNQSNTGRQPFRTQLFPGIGEVPLYHTGDLGWIDSQQRIHFAGRRDTQVKLRGHRIELVEVESTLQEHPMVKAAVLMVLGTDSETRQLAGFYQTEAGQALDPENLTAYAAEKLPSYMVPGILIQVDAFPLNANGKIDHRSLHGLADARELTRSAQRPPESRQEKAIFEIWSLILPRPPESVEDNFFSLGGNSLLAMRMINMLEKEFNQSVNFGSLLENPTIASLATLLATPKTTPPSTSSGVVMLREGAVGHIPLLGAYGHAYHSSPLIWKRLADHLSIPQPVIGLQGGGLNGSFISHTTLSSLAREHAREALPLVAEKGCIVAGYCAGGFLAFEMVIQLQKLGVPVHHLILVDAMAPDAKGILRLSKRLHRLQRHIYLVGKQGPRYAWKLLFGTMCVRIESLKRKFRYKRIMAQNQHAASIPQDLRLDYMEGALAHLLNSWYPQKIACRLDLIRTPGTKDSTDDYGWAPYIEGPVNIHLIHTPHQMMDTKHVNAVSRVFENLLREVNS